MKHRCTIRRLDGRLRAVVLGSAVALTGCNLPDRMPTSTDPSGRVAMSMQASFVAIAADRLNARVFYVRTVGSRGILIDSTAKIERNSSGGVSWTGTRGFPFEFDLAPCLLDDTHVVAGSGCLVGIAVRLLQGGQLLDSIDIAPAQVEPGKITTITRTIILREIQSITVPPASIDVGTAVPLEVRIIDASGATVTGRPIEWVSDAPAIARVSPTGIVTGLAPGEALISARAGGRTGSARVRVSAGEP